MNKLSFKVSLKVFCLIVITAVIPLNNISGQTTMEKAKKLERPKDCGVSNYDHFKNSSFNLLEEVLKTDKNYKKTRTEIRGYLSGEKEATRNGIDTEINKAKAVLKSVQAMDERVKKLTADGNKLSHDIAGIEPPGASRQASYNTKTSMDAVHLSDNLMHAIADTVTLDIQVLVHKITTLEGTVKEEKTGIEKTK